MSTSSPVRPGNGAMLIIAATVVAGAAGYLVTWLVYRQVGPASYAVFAVFWASMYLLVGGISGVQQEITRATRAIEPGTRERASRARTFGVVLGVGVAALVVASAPLWVAQVFPAEGWGLVLPLAVGVGSYVLVATLCGSLYGVSQWRSLTLMIAGDGLLRMLLVGVALAFSAETVVLAWAVALPFPLAILVLWPVIRRGLVGRSELDVGYRSLSWNVARTILASVSTAVLVSGFPLLLGLAGVGAQPTLLGELIFTITLVRAPLIVGVMSLQSLLVVRFRDDTEHRARTLGTVVAGIGAGVVVLGFLGWLLGPAVLTWVSGHPTRIDGLVICVLVVSSGIVAALSVTGAAALASRRHVVYLAGWAVAALVTIAAMLLPVPFVDRVLLALLTGPATGLLVHAAWLLGTRGRRQ